MKYISILLITLALLQASSCDYSSVKLDQVESWFDDFTSTNTGDEISASALIYFQTTNASLSPSLFWKIHGKCNNIDGVEWADSPTSSAVFRLASVTKLFTATATMQLYEKGLLALDDTLVQHVPWLTGVANDERISQVKIIHLLTHTLGIDNRIINSFSKVGAETNIETFVRNNWQPFVRSPGTVVAYSNMAVILQGLLIETVSKTNFVDYMHANIFEPLGITSAKFMHENNDNYDAICFPANAKSNSYEPYATSGLASGDLAISLEDMVKFLNAHLNNGTGLFQFPETAILMHTPTFHAGLIPDIFGGLALQFYTETYRGQHVLTHSGALFEFNTVAAIFPNTMEGLFVAEITTRPLSGGYVYSSYRSFLDHFYGQNVDIVTYPETTADKTKLEKLYDNQFGSSARVQLGTSKFFSVFGSSYFAPINDGEGVEYVHNGQSSAYYPITLPRGSNIRANEIVLQRDPAETNQTMFLIVTFDTDGNIKYIETWPDSSGNEEIFGDGMVTNMVLFAFDGFASVFFIVVCIAKIARLVSSKCEMFKVAKKRSQRDYKTNVGFMVLYFLAGVLCIGAIVTEAIALVNYWQLYIGLPGQVIAFNIFLLVKMVIIMFLGLVLPLLVLSKKMHFELWERVIFILVVLCQIAGIYALANLNLVQFRFW